MKRVLIICTTDSMIWNFLIPHIKLMEKMGIHVDCACSITGDFFQNLKNDYSLNIYEFPFERSPYKLKNIVAYRRLCDFVHSNKYDTIFCHEPIGGLMGRLVGHKFKCKVIYMAHGFHFYVGAPSKNWIIYYTIEKYLSKYTDLLIVINNEDYRLAINKLNAKKVIQIPGIGVDINRFKSHNIDISAKRAQLCIPNDMIWILSVGELTKRKNHELLIKAILNIENVYLTIAGNGELYQYLYKLIDDIGLSNRVKLLGHRTDIAELCEAADIFAMPSFQEGLSVALMEAMACAKPCIVSSIRGNIDLIDENGGELFNPYCVKSCSESIQKLLNSNMSSKGDYNAKKILKYSINVVLNKMYTIYSSY